ncbi:MAG: hypothetical protein FWD75_08225 [Propionibacteriaceae bacterium]|nr:hypothetical protein [Propionibacteriaceae bacterium]
MPDENTVSVAGQRVAMILPGTWTNVPLDDETSARALVHDLVRRRMGTDDHSANMRADAVDDTMATIASGVAAGVHTYLISLELVPGVPFPAAILMADEPWPVTAQPGLGADDLLRALTEGFPGGAVLDLRSGPAVRVADHAQAAAPLSRGPVSRLEYHIPYPDRAQVLYARVSTPHLPVAGPITDLFDQIIDSITFPDGAVDPPSATPASHDQSTRPTEPELCAE